MLRWFRQAVNAVGMGLFLVARPFMRWFVKPGDVALVVPERMHRATNRTGRRFGVERLSPTEMDEGDALAYHMHELSRLASATTIFEPAPRAAEPVVRKGTRKGVKGPRAVPRPWREAGRSRPPSTPLRASILAIQLAADRTSGHLRSRAFRRRGGSIDGRLNHLRLIDELGMDRALLVAGHYKAIVDTNPWLLLRNPADSVIRDRLLGVFATRGWLIEGEI